MRQQFEGKVRGNSLDYRATQNDLLEEFSLFTSRARGTGQDIVNEEVKGLGWIPGEVVNLKPKNTNLKIPHMGWNEIKFGKDEDYFSILNKKDFYFVHSYYSQPTDKRDIVGFTDYSNMQFPSIIKKENAYLIVQRNRNKHLGLKWEFPGGKVLLNETPKDALIREIKEELKHPTDDRVRVLSHIIYNELLSIDEIYEISKIDKWFLREIKKIISFYYNLNS